MPNQFESQLTKVSSDLADALQSLLLQMPKHCNSDLGETFDDIQDKNLFSCMNSNTPVSLVFRFANH